MNRSLAALLAALLVTSPALRVRAAEDTTAVDTPWSAGVAAVDRDAALALFKDGNDLFAQSEYAEAARKYRAALARWSHPAIAGNLAVALIHLDSPLEASQLLEAALRFGATPFEPHVYQQLVTHQKLLAGQLARVEVACPMPEVALVLDGATELACPGKSAQVVLVGRHQVVARRRGYLTFAREFTALAGTTTHIDVSLQPLETAGGVERRWATWKPWAVVGAGAALVLIGVPLQLAARSNLDAYEQEVARSCPNGCRREDLPEAVWDLEARGHLENRLAIGAFVVGGLTAVTGAVLTYMNRPQRVRLEESGRRVAVVPHDDGAAFVLELTF